MLGVLIAGAALKAASSIYGGAEASSAAREARRYVQKQLQQNQDWYNRRYNEDATQRADAQSAITQTEDYLRRRNRAAAGTQAVMGGTEESVAAEKERNNQTLANTIGKINAAGAARKDTVEQQYLNNKSQLTGQLVGIEQQRAQAITDATQGVGTAVGDGLQGIAGAYGAK